MSVFVTAPDNDFCQRRLRAEAPNDEFRELLNCCTFLVIIAHFTLSVSAFSSEESPNAHFSSQCTKTKSNSSTFN